MRTLEESYIYSQLDVEHCNLPFVGFNLYEHGNEKNPKQVHIKLKNGKNNNLFKLVVLGNISTKGYHD